MNVSLVAFNGLRDRKIGKRMFQMSREPETCTISTFKVVALAE